MTIGRNVHGTMRGCEVWVLEPNSKANAVRINLDHILQISFQTSINTISEGCELTITKQEYLRLKTFFEKRGYLRNAVGDDSAFTGWRVLMKLWDNSGTETDGFRLYDSIVVSMRGVTNKKADTILMILERWEYAKLSQYRHWVAKEKVSTAQILKEVLEACDIKLFTPRGSGTTISDSDLHTITTFWEAFAMPMGTPSIHYLCEELSKDSIMFFVVPANGTSEKMHGYETPDFVQKRFKDENGNEVGPNFFNQGYYRQPKVVIFSWYDITQYNNLHWSYLKFAVGTNSDNRFFANFQDPRINDEWLKTTFVKAKQSDSRALWYIKGFEGSRSESWNGMAMQECVYFDGSGEPKYWHYQDKNVRNNELGLTMNKFIYSGEDLVKAQISPWPAIDAIFENKNTPKVRNPWFYTNNNIYPKYYHHRMRDNYSRVKRTANGVLTTSGSLHNCLPTTLIAISDFSNQKVEDPNKTQPKNSSTSGLYLITSCLTVISGNNITTQYSLLKPYENLDAGLEWFLGEEQGGDDPDDLVVSDRQDIYN